MASSGSLCSFSSTCRLGTAGQPPLCRQEGPQAVPQPPLACTSPRASPLQTRITPCTVHVLPQPQSPPRGSEQVTGAQPSLLQTHHPYTPPPHYSSLHPAPQG